MSTTDQKLLAILENQIVMAETMWMLLQAQGGGRTGALASLSSRINASRQLLEQEEEPKR